MKKLYLALLAASVATPAFAADKITVLQATQLSTALRNLDGHMVVVKQNGADATLMIPWDFGSGVLRLRIANDIAIVDDVLKRAEEARLGIVRELLKKFEARTGEKATDLKAGTPEFDEFQKQYLEMIAQPAGGSQDLARIKASELKLDRNEIPVTVLSALRPILDDDVAPK